jgi:hypothetical protein
MPAYCSTQSSCVWNSDNSIVGCCATASSECKFYTSCVDLNSPQQTADSDNVYTWFIPLPFTSPPIPP